MIVVEDGTGLPTANAFASVAEIDAILATNIHSTWATVDNTSKENLIQWATRLLIERSRWKGYRVSKTSGTPFPRTGLCDDDGVYYPSNAVPIPVKVAVATLADLLATEDPTLPNASSNLKRLDVDVISLQFDLGFPAEKWPSSIGTILRNIAFVSFGKLGGKRIVKH